MINSAVVDPPSDGENVITFLNTVDDGNNNNQNTTSEANENVNYEPSGGGGNGNVGNNNVAQRLLPAPTANITMSTSNEAPFRDWSRRDYRFQVKNDEIFTQAVADYEIKDGSYHDDADDSYEGDEVTSESASDSNDKFVDEYLSHRINRIHALLGGKRYTGVKPPPQSAFLEGSETGGRGGGGGGGGGGKLRPLWKVLCTMVGVICIVVGLIGKIFLRHDHKGSYSTKGLVLLRETLLPISGDALKDPSSHQYEAFQWIADNHETLIQTFLKDQKSNNDEEDDDDKTLLFFSSTFLEETYILALLYFATEGSKWHDVNDVANHTDVFMNPRIPFCQWNIGKVRGVYCNAPQTNLIRIDLQSYNLHGTIPFELGHLSSLLVLQLNENKLTGTVPSELGSLSELRVLHLHENHLKGTIPSELGNIGNQSPFEGKIVFSLGGNHIGGTIPSELGKLPAESIVLSDNLLHGSIPSELVGPDLHELLLQNNRLGGELPLSLFTMTKTKKTNREEASSLRVLRLENNDLGGTLPKEIGSFNSSLVKLSLSMNQFTGHIPPSIGSLNPHQFQILRLDNNQFSGHVPSVLRKLQGLTFISLENNNLSGNFTEIFCDDTNDVLIKDSIFPDLIVVGADMETCTNNRNSSSTVECTCCCCSQGNDNYVCANE